VKGKSLVIPASILTLIIGVAYYYDAVTDIVSGVLISIASVYIWEFLRKPRLKLDYESQPAIQNTRPQRALYHIRVTNIGKTVANDCDVSIIFYDVHRTTLFSITAKWARGPEPIIPVPVRLLANLGIESEDRAYTSLIPLSSFANIRPGERSSDSFSFLMKYEGENECYGFSPWSYEHRELRNPAWQLGIGNYLIDVLVKGGNVEKRARYYLSNMGTLFTDIRLIELFPRHELASSQV
jgi:hypothetical protein